MSKHILDFSTNSPTNPPGFDPPKRRKSSAKSAPKWKQLSPALFQTKWVWGQTCEKQVLIEECKQNALSPRFPWLLSFGLRWAIVLFSHQRPWDSCGHVGLLKPIRSTGPEAKNKPILRNEIAGLTWNEQCSYLKFPHRISFCLKMNDSKL